MKELLSHLPPEKQEELQLLTECLASFKNVEMLILFGSYARGNFVEDSYVEKGIHYEYKSDYDLLVVTTHDDLKEKFRIEEQIEKQLEATGKVRTTPSLIFHSIKHLNQALTEGNYFFQDIKKEGIFLHDTGRCQLQNAKKLTPEESRQKAQGYFDQWFKSANMFFSNFKSNFDKGAKDKDFYNVAAFELHQATERYYTAILLVFTDYRPKEHNLERLDLRVRNCDSQFDVFPRGTEEEKHRFELLQKAYIDARYKMDEYVITQNDLEYLADRVNHLKDLTEQICKDKIETIGG
ncbi:MAG: HEPN domain-containing protein [Reichenbachiella sp.]|uniref:HEPN domain-containing protein n=1 Tax=Reichenbachiella sp. TaxID=2184521 RepID=UPI0032969D27